MTGGAAVNAGIRAARSGAAAVLAAAALVAATGAGAAPTSPSTSTATASAQPEPGDIFVVDPDVLPASTAVLFQVDPQTGARTVLSNFGGSNPNAVAVEADGDLLVTDTDAGTDPSGGINEGGRSIGSVQTRSRASSHAPY